MSAGPRLFIDSSVLIRYFAGDDPPRALAAAQLLDASDGPPLVVSTGLVLEVVHVLRTRYGVENPRIAEVLASFLTRENVHVADADRHALVAAIRWSTRASARRIPDAILAAAAEQAGCERIATFDEAFVSPSVPVRLL